MKSYTRTVEQLAAERISVPATGCGIYFLFRGDTIVYVGQSMSIVNRIGQHLAGPMEFDFYSWFAVPENQLNAAETHHIKKFRPKYNKMKNSCGEKLTLTDDVLASMKSRQDDSWTADTEISGLGVRHSPAGHISLCLRYRNNQRKQRKIMLCRAGDAPIDEVRAMARRILASVRSGEEPTLYRKSKKEGQKIWLDLQKPL